MITNLRKIRDHKPCQKGYHQFMKSFGGPTESNLDKPITLRAIFEKNGLSSAIWALRTCTLTNHQRFQLLGLAEKISVHALELYEYENKISIRDELKQEDGNALISKVLFFSYIFYIKSYACGKTVNHLHKTGMWDEAYKEAIKEAEERNSALFAELLKEL